MFYYQQGWRRHSILALALLGFGALGGSSVHATELQVPIFSEGFYGDFSWLYLQPTPTDGDLEYGTLLTLTGDPANLTAHVAKISPDYHSAFRLNTGYQIPCTGNDLNCRYFYFYGDKTDAIPPIAADQLIQNFLGASYSTANASENQRIHQLDLALGQQLIVDRCWALHPYLSLSYADIKRTLNVRFSDLVLNPFSSSLKGRLRSHYWGIGPIVGADFTCPLYRCLTIRGHFGAGALIGNRTSSLDSTSIRQPMDENFHARESNRRIAAVIQSDLGIAYSQLLCRGKLALEIAIGYEADTYFKGVDRTDPFNGYVNNPGAFPFTTSSNLGLGGPYVRVSLKDRPLPISSATLACCVVDDWVCGFYGRFTSAWLRPDPTNQDLTYAVLRTTGGADRGISTHPNFAWTGSYDLGYHFPCSLDVRASYFRLDTSDRSSVTAGPNQGISSLNASGPGEVLFGSASSRVRYELNQVELVAGKYGQFCKSWYLEALVGLRYAKLERTLHNHYLDGIPPLTTEFKSPVLRSDFNGLGPIFGLEPTWMLNCHLGAVGRFDAALLMGNIKSTLDQVNTGVVGSSSNNLRTDRIEAIVPIVDAKIGLRYTCKLCCLPIHIEAGYQYTQYFRGVNLVFPTLLTGLEQLSSDLILSGPYVSIAIGDY